MKSMSGYADELGEMLAILPASVRERLERGSNANDLIEVVLDYGRPAEARYRERVDRMHDLIVTEKDIEFVIKSIGEFGTDNRAGIERTLHQGAYPRPRGRCRVCAA